MGTFLICQQKGTGLEKTERAWCDHGADAGVSERGSRGA